MTGDPRPFERLREWLLDNVAGEDEGPGSVKEEASELLAADLGIEKGNNGAYADVLDIGGVGIDKLLRLVVGDVFEGEPEGLRCRLYCMDPCEWNGLASPVFC